MRVYCAALIIFASHMYEIGVSCCISASRFVSCSMNCSDSFVNRSDIRPSFVYV